MGWYCNAGNRSLQAPRTRAHITWIKSISSGMASRSASEQDTSRHAASVHRGHGLGQRNMDAVTMARDSRVRRITSRKGPPKAYTARPADPCLGKADP